MTTYKVAISAGDGGSVSPDGEIEVAAASDVWMYAAPDDGHTVAEWFHDGEPWGCDVGSYVIPGIARDATVHVTFRRITHGVTTTPCDGAESSQGTLAPRSSIDSGPITVAHGGSLTFTATPVPGCRVDAWTVDGTVVARGTDTYTLAGITADHLVAVTFDLPPLAPVIWRGTVAVTWRQRTAPAAANTTRRADVVLSQADIDASSVPGPVRAVKGGSERHRDVRTEQVKATLNAGPADAQGHVGTVELWRYDRVEHARTQWVSYGLPARRRRITHTHLIESYPLGSRRGADPVALWARQGAASVSIAYDAGQWQLAVRLAPPGVDGERREDSWWTVSGEDPPSSEPVLTSTRLTTEAFERRFGTGVTNPDVTRLKGRRTFEPGKIVVAWDLRLDSR